MQNIGFEYVMLPGFKAIYGKDSEALNNALRRYFPFFNTQPYMAPAIAGVCLNHEEKGDISKISNLQHTIESSLAAIGDTFFWKDLKPIVSLICVLSFIFQSIWGIVLTLIMFNVLHIWIMVGGFNKGYSDGINGVFKIGKTISANRIGNLSYAIPLLAGILFMVLPEYTKSTISLCVASLFSIAFIVAYQIKINAIWIFYTMSIILIIWSVLG